ncbi:HEAT repeat domain-containing protein [bacterium]|nr:HEAT repeat domain-containing protein [bacterium]
MKTHINTQTNLEGLMEQLGQKDGLKREHARYALIALGSAAVPCLVNGLENSHSDRLRWEAAKALGSIGDADAIPALVEALEDDDADVQWVAADALVRFGKDAWPALLRKLSREGAESLAFERGVHHIFRNQHEKPYADLLEALTHALDPGLVSDDPSIVAEKLLARLEEQG